jgi:hypothetical protein
MVPESDERTVKLLIGLKRVPVEIRRAVTLSVVEKLTESPALYIPGSQLKDQGAALLHNLLAHGGLDHGVVEANDIQGLVYTVADSQFCLEILQGLARTKVVLNL